mgnify:CR=1 FL=1|jgi:hypothetical protein
MPKSKVRKKNGKKVKYQAPKKKQFSMKEIQRLTELLKKMQNVNPQEINAVSENADQLAEIPQYKNEDNSEIPQTLPG